MHQSHEIATIGGGCFRCLEVFFSIYRIIEQEKAVREIIAQIDEAKIWGAWIVTEQTPFTEFYPAYEIMNKEMKRKMDNRVQVGVVRKKDIIQSVKTSVDLGLGVKNRNEIQIKSDGVKEIENIIVNIL